MGDAREYRQDLARILSSLDEQAAAARVEDILTRGESVGLSASDIHHMIVVEGRPWDQVEDEITARAQGMW